MKVAIYGGSFNPPHCGHVKVAEVVSEKIKPDKFLIIPDYLPPHKTMEEGSPSPEMRYEMCKLAFSGIEDAEVTPLEINREGRSYTADTVEYLSGIYPGAELMLVIGSDMLLSFTEWVRFEYLLRSCTLVVLSRFGSDVPQLQEYADRLKSVYGADIIILEHNPVITNSSILRNELRSGIVDKDIPESVYEYIKLNGLY